MKEIVRMAIKRIYTDCDHDYYRQRCRIQVGVVSAAINQLSTEGISIIEEFGDISPSRRWSITYDKVNSGDFKAHIPHP